MAIHATKLYIVGPADNGEGVYSLLTAEGEVLAEHYCSHIGYALGDLEADRPERQVRYRERFGAYSVVFAGGPELSREALIERNRAWYAAPADDQRS